MTQKSAGVHYYKANSERNKPISDWEEWQANTLGAAILLPENLIKQGMYLFGLGEKIECLNKIYFPGIYKRFDALADFLGCSKKALAICPKCLSDYIHDPNYVVRRLDPFAKSKDHCDKCNNSGWDYIVYDKRTSVKGKGCRNE